MKKALEPLILAWGVPDLRRRMLFVLAAVFFFVVALNIPVPGVNHANITNLLQAGGGLLNFIDIFGGGALSKLSIMALGIMPYITASIVFQILTIAFPAIKELQQEGEYGRRKIAQWTRWAAIALTLVQATVAVRAFQSAALGILPPGVLMAIQAILALTAGTMFLIWLGEQMTQRGVGNGISFIIFAGIVAQLPRTLGELVTLAQTDATIWLKLLGLLAVFIGTIYAVITITQGERRIPVKYAPRQAGQRVVQGQRSFLPLKMAAAGVIPIIFAVSLVLFPGQIATMYLQANQGANTTWVSVAEFVQRFSSVGRGWESVPVSLLYALLVMVFTYFYTAVLFDVRDLADNLKRAGGQVQGYAPGRPTEMYINRVLTRITFAGGLFLALIALMQWWIPTFLGLNNVSAAGSLLVGGTSLLIVVGVALEILQNLDQQLKMRQYEGLANRMQKGRL